MFLAIAVDNLATAQELTAEQEEAEALAKEQKEKSAAKEATMFMPNQLLSQVQISINDAESGTAPNQPVAAMGKTNAGKPAAPANAKTPAANTNTNMNKSPATLQPQQMPLSKTNSLTNTSVAKKPKLNTNLDVDKMVTTRVDLDYIPGLDDDLKVILPGNFHLCSLLFFFLLYRASY